MDRSYCYPNRSLYIRSIPMDTKSDDLRSVFCKFGHVKDVYIPRDYYTRKLRGFAYVEFEKLRDAEIAMRNTHKLRLFGKELEVEFAQGDRKTPSEMRYRYMSRSTSFRPMRSSRRFERSPYTPRYRKRSRSRSRSRRELSRSPSRSIIHFRSMSPELRIEKKSSHYYDDGDLDNRYKKSHDIDLDELA